MAIDILIKNAICVSHNGIEPSDVAIKDDIIVAIGHLDDVDAEEVIDATGLHLLPGVIDTQVHFREPGAEAKEDLESGSRAAVMGGVTAVFEMPNTKPATTTAKALNDKVKRATNRMWCDFAFFMGASKKNAKKLNKLERLPGCCGIKIFMGSSTGDLLVSDDQTLADILSNGTRRIAIHAEDEDRLIERQALSEEGDVSQHPVWRDAKTAYMATDRILEIARRTGRRIHVLHVTTEDEMALLAAYKDVASVEVTPQHLTLSAPDCYE
ncbi:Dihydroorotase, partial [hydrothermal vent metagenome]